VLTSDGKVLGEALATQAELHAPWGGVVPSIAQAAHKEAIDRVVDAALSQAGISAADLDAVAVTVGPGLSLCLDVGVRKAREVSRQHGLPLVPVHHMEVGGHVAVTCTPPQYTADCTHHHNTLLLCIVVVIMSGCLLPCMSSVRMHLS
jgi:tRNA A37 threonylcarbamoyltransferase TsaD